MKTLTLTVVGTVDADNDTRLAAARDKAEKTCYEAEGNQDKINKANATYAEKRAELESNYVPDTTAAARALVDSLRESGVNIQSATLLFGARPGSHEANESVDLAPAAAVVEGGATEPAVAADAPA